MNVLLAVAFGVAVLIFVVMLVVRDRARSKRLEQQARLLGLSFEDVSNPLEGVHPGRIPLLLENASAGGFNVLTGTVRGLQVRVFDLRNEAVELPFWTTVAGFHLDTAALPTFELGVKGLGERISKVLKKPQVVVNHQGFGPQYSIRCVTDQKQTYDFLTPTRLQQLRLHLGNFHLACCPEWVFIYRPGFKVEPSDLPRFMERASEIASSLLYETPASDPKGETGRDGTRHSHVAGAGR